MTATRQADFDFVRTLASELSHREFDIPPFPETTMRVREALGKPNVSIDMIARIVTAEPVLTTRLVRMANSVLLRRGPIEITDLSSAISRLGFDVVRNTAISMAMDTTFSAPRGSPLCLSLNSIRRHCIHVSALSFILAIRYRFPVRAEAAMLTGLLHDIGRLYILHRAHRFPVLFEDTAQLQELMAAWHGGVGRAIVENWGFPEEIALAVEEHDNMRREHDGSPDLADVIQIANLAVNLQDASEEALQEIDGLPACRVLGVDHTALMTILRESEEELHSLEQALGG